jgi:AcrR family transcriptional regulator
VPRAGLTPSRVVDEAAAFADEVGFDNVTLAGVADRFGVRLPSLYKHVAGIDALRDKLRDRATAELTSVLNAAASGLDAGAAVSALAHAYRSWALEHPGRYQATVRAPDPRDEAALASAARATEAVTIPLAGFGLKGDATIDAARLLRATLHGFVALELDGGFGLPKSVDRSFDHAVAALVDSLRRWPERETAMGSR